MCPLTGGEEVVGSNPIAPTIKGSSVMPEGLFLFPNVDKPQ